MTKAARKAPAPRADRREPTDREKKAGNEAADRHISTRDEREKVRASMPRLGHKWDGENGVSVVCAPHNDANGWTAQLVESLGTVDPRAASFLFNTAISSGIAPTKPTDEATGAANTATVENALAFVADMQPQNALEAALVLQMAATHTASMTMSRHAARASMRDELGDYSRMMNQTMRTFTAQAEALHKLRTGGKQQVEVRYVYVDARTQTVVNGGSGDGGALPFPNQPHTPGALGYAPAAGLPVWSEDPAGDALSFASGEGAETMPDARRQQPRSPERTGERKLHLRAVDSGGHRGAGPRPGASQNVQNDAAWSGGVI